MNLTMYSDSEKNLVMFLPDDFTDEDIMAFGQMAVPDEIFYNDYSDFPDALSKPTCFLNLNNMHASFPLSSIYPDSFVPPSF
ncbi:MAG: hypothetical protein K6E78_06425 [Treponema sp.]|nr:hypothetical protein [Treponema sp.]